MSKFELQEKVAIVTGGAGGIGSSIALEYARAGAKVVICSRNRDNLEKVAGQVRAAGGECLAIPTDVTLPQEVERLVRQTVDRFGRLDILVSCAGDCSFSKPEEISPDAWNSSILLNLNATFYCCAAAGKVMKAQRGGKVINISSAVSLKGDPLLAPYVAAKAGVIGLTKSLALAWAPYNINVNCIAPGRVTLPGDVPEGVPHEKHKQQETGTTAASGKPPSPLELPGRPEDVASLALFLASSASDLITGETLVVRGAEWASVYI